MKSVLLDLPGEAVLLPGDLPEIALDGDVDGRRGAVAIAAADGVVLECRSSVIVDRAGPFIRPYFRLDLGEGVLGDNATRMMPVDGLQGPHRPHRQHHRGKRNHKSVLYYGHYFSTLWHLSVLRHIIVLPELAPCKPTSAELKYKAG